MRSFAGSNKKNLQFIFFKKSIVQKKKRTVGPQNGASQLFLAAIQIQVSQHVFFLLIILSSKFLNNFPVEGSFVIADVKTEGKILTLANIYAPNDDNPTFFKNVLNQLTSFECGEIVLGGDYNLVLEVKKDKIGGNPKTHKNSLKEVLYIANFLDLVDIWRIFNPDAKIFTRRRRKPDIHCRLDFFLTSSSLSTTITKANLLPGFKTDHSLITLHLTNNTNPRGPGFWKLNTSFLLESEYVNLIKKTINEVANVYKNDNEVDSVLLWETMKLQIQSSSL